MNKVPDEVIFGRDKEENVKTYGQVRAVTDENELISLLEIRLIHYFIKQVEPLKISKSAFPLTTLTCIGIETLGEIFITCDKDDTSFQFVEILKSLNQVFSRKLTKKYEERFREIWDTKDIIKINNYAKIIYRFFRNTMIHGFHAQGMFLSYEDTITIRIDESSGFMVINPDWFWEIFKTFFTKNFAAIKKAQANNPQRINCLNYIQNILLS